MDISQSTVSLIGSAEPFTADVHNRPHNEMVVILQEVNRHHNNPLIHDGEFTINGDLTVTGTTTAITSTLVFIEDPLIQINSDGGTAEDGGFTITASVTGNDYWLKYDSSLNNNFKIRDGRGSGEIGCIDGFGSLATAEAISGNQAVNLGQWDSLAAVIAVTYTPTGTYNEYLINPNGATSLSISIDPKAETINSDNWTAGASLNTARGGTPMGAGTSNCGLVEGGSGTSALQNSWEWFNGASWIAGGFANTLRYYTSGCGLRNAALVCGGTTTAGAMLSGTEIFNGILWTASANMTSTRYAHAAVGKMNAALATCGTLNGVFATGSSERWSGTSWATTTAASILRSTHGIVGHQNFAMVCAGYTHLGPAALDSTEIYNGVSNAWSTAATTNVQRMRTQAAGVVNNAILISGANVSETTLTSVERYNGFTWVLATTIPTAVGQFASCGSGNQAQQMGGQTVYAGPVLTTVQKYIYHPKKKFMLYFDDTRTYLDSSGGLTATTSANYVCVSIFPDWNDSTELTDRIDLSTKGFDFDLRGGAWSATGNLNTAVRDQAAVGVQNASLTFGGMWLTTVFYTVSERFNGSTWSNTGVLNTQRAAAGRAGCLNAALAIAGGYSQFLVNPLTSVEKYNGSTWSVSTAITNPTIGPGSAGIQNSALLIAGSAQGLGVQTACYKFNGSSWSSTGSLPIARYIPSSTGIQNSALAVAGTVGASYTGEKFNGSTWISLPLTNGGHLYNTMNGTSTYAMVCGNATDAERFNGFLWYRLTFTLAVGFGSFTGTPDAGLYCGGGNNGQVDSYKFITTGGYTDGINLTTE